MITYISLYLWAVRTRRRLARERPSGLPGFDTPDGAAVLRAMLTETRETPVVRVVDGAIVSAPRGGAQ